MATELSRRGARVYATGRSVAEADLPEPVQRCPCDHPDDVQTEAVFGRMDGTVPEPLTREDV